MGWLVFVALLLLAGFGCFALIVLAGTAQKMHADKEDTH